MLTGARPSLESSYFVCSLPTALGKSFRSRAMLILSPIVLLAFTNHALDHILRAIHDNNVTHDMIRLGSRSKDEVVSQYSMESLENVKRPDATLRRRAAGLYGKLKGLGSVSPLRCPTLHSETVVDMSLGHGESGPNDHFSRAGRVGHHQPSQDRPSHGPSELVRRGS